MYLQNIVLGGTAGLAVLPWISASSTKGQAACTTAAFPRPELFGLEILDLSVAEHRNQTVITPTAPPTNFTVSYCGVNVCVDIYNTIRHLTDPQQHVHSPRLERYCQRLDLASSRRLEWASDLDPAH